MKTRFTFLAFYVLFGIAVFAQPSNDACTSAQFITINTSFQNIDFDLTNATVNNESGCSGDPADDYVDVWYQFIMPVTGKLYINGSVTKNRFNIYNSCNGTELHCFTSNKLIDDLIQGSSYILRVRRWLPHNDGNNQSFLIRAYETPANDTCNNSETIIVDNTVQSVDFNIGGAVINNEAACNGDSPDDYTDVWFDFTMPVTGYFNIESNSSFNNFVLYDACGGNEIVCFNQSQTLTTLTQGQNYKLRIFRSETATLSHLGLSFTVQAYEFSLNDNCLNAENINLTTNTQTVNFSMLGATINNEIACNESSADNYADLWYSFTMPVDGSLEIMSASTINKFSLYNACNGTLIYCSPLFYETSIPLYVDELEQGESYILKVYREEDQVDNMSYNSFTLKATDPTILDCSSPEVLTVTTTETTIDLDLDSAVYNHEIGCDDTDIDDYTDFWYEFTMPVNGNLYINPSTSYNYNKAAIYNACGGNLLYCFSENKLIDDLVQGQTYLLRIYRPRTIYPDGNQFAIRAYERISNDICSNAEVLPTLTSDNTAIYFNLGGASVSTEETCIGDSDYILDAWWQVTMPITGNLFVDTPGGNGIAVYDACNGNQLFCALETSSAFKLIDNLIEGNTYLIRFFNTESTLFGPADFHSMNLRVFERAENDACANAETIPTITDTAQEINFYTFGSEINEEYGCGTFNLEDYVDVWFEFTMPNLPGNLTITSYVYNHYAVFDACNGNEIHCFQGSDQVEGLIPGETYILRAFQRQNEMFHPYAFFDIWVDNTLGIEDQSLENTINIYPNPVRDYINISIANNQTITAIQCYDLMGKQIFNSTYKEQINVSYLKSGLYLLKIETLSGSFIKKIMVE
ncbi:MULTISPECIES: T9SS type A sorting domain-containing protein [Meridianimaribacter]|uniref:Secreted protein (Por secretion system target) n=1 Tax=Meridianimaribacter flavus TaxID=571115 RepID=A0ABY2G2Z6_9FLAO|nr:MULTISPECIES: T9SS type A sorting domain-containing protein [Meridianimaribacter]TBV25226.1 hypothetical protein DMZ43_13020 [Meridianimaribacter sp. CL38]TDY10643.1 putative secreted protein (Por secretion system target) [Meridianimaribacter flavus]